MNNMPNHTVVAWRDESKLELQKNASLQFALKAQKIKDLLQRKLWMLF